MFKKKVLSVFALLTMSGCASIVSGSKQDVRISSTPLGADFTIKEVKSGNIVKQGKTPGTVELERGESYFRGKDYTVDFVAPNRVLASQRLDASINPWYIGNIGFGGMIGLVVVDPITGAMWKLPEEINVTLPPPATAQAASQ